MPRGDSTDLSALDDIIRRAEDEKRRRQGGDDGGFLSSVGDAASGAWDAVSGSETGQSIDRLLSDASRLTWLPNAVGSAVEEGSISEGISTANEEWTDPGQRALDNPGEFAGDSAMVMPIPGARGLSGMSGALRGGLSAADDAARPGAGLLGRIGSSRIAQGAARQSGLVGTGQRAGRIGSALGRAGRRAANPPSQGGRLARNVGLGAGGLMGYGALFGDEEAVDEATQGGPTLADQLGGGQQGDAAGAGGGASSGGPPPTQPGYGVDGSSSDPMTALDGIIGDLEGQSQQIEEDFQNQRDQLREQFQLSETPEEQAQLAFMLEDLEARRDAAQGAIAKEYGRAQDKVRDVAADTRQRAETARQPIEGRYQQGAQAARQGQQNVREDYASSGVGVGAVDPDTSVESTADMMEQRALSEGDFAEKRTNIAASDSEWLADTLAAEEPAQQGALQRQIAMQQGQAQREHAQQVNDRVAQDRRTLAQLEAQLMNQQHTRQSSILDRAAQLQMQQEQLRQEQGGSQGMGNGDSAMSGDFPQNLVGNPELQTQTMLGLQAEGQTGMMRSLIQGGFIDDSVAQIFQGAIAPGGDQ